MDKPHISACWKWTWCVFVFVDLLILLVEHMFVSVCLSIVVCAIVMLDHGQCARFVWQDCFWLLAISMTSPCLIINIMEFLCLAFATSCITELYNNNTNNILFYFVCDMFDSAIWDVLLVALHLCHIRTQSFICLLHLFLVRRMCKAHRVSTGCSGHYKIRPSTRADRPEAIPHRVR